MPWFIAHPSGHRYPVGPSGLTLGRAVDNDVVLNDEQASRHHAMIQLQDEQAWLYDRNSFNGVFVAESRIDPTTPYLLRNGDAIRLGSTPLRAEYAAPLVALPPNDEAVRLSAHDEASPQPAPAPPSSAQLPSPRAEPLGLSRSAERSRRSLGTKPRDEASRQMWQAALIGAVIGLAGLVFVFFLVVRPLWQSSAPPLGAPGSSYGVYTPAIRAVAFLLTPIEETPDSVASTGVVLSEKGRILTAYSAVYDPGTGRPYNRKSQVLVGLSSDPSKRSTTLDRWYLARIVRADRQRDLAVLQIFAQQDNSPLPNSFRWTVAPTPSTTLRASTSVNTLQIGDPIVALGFPGAVRLGAHDEAAPTGATGRDQPLAFGQGQVKGFAPDPALGLERGWIQSTLTLGQANLGSLVLDQRGRLVGLYTGAPDFRPLEVAEPLLKGAG